MFLEKINGPCDVKKLSLEEKVVLAGEMRNALLKKLSKCGGHFGPNFGVVELTIALHSVFSSPIDKIIFDVSHQSYCHKMLTGRKDAFLKPELYQSVTGFSSPEESEHDFFTIGHTSTSISLACGMAKARDLKKEQSNIIAVIGDGSLSGGEAFEGLDYAWELHSNLIVIINDNGMSISDNYGGIYQNLKELRESQGKCENNYFRALGFEYRYVGDGHDIGRLIDAFTSVKDIDHPVVLHVQTQKGKGYLPAERHMEDWHWFPAFIPETGEPVRKLSGENYDDIACEFLLNKIQKDPTVAVMVAAVPLTIGFTEEKRKIAGSQFIDVGIAEQHAISMAAGIAKGGGKAVFATHSSFFQRAYDQIAQDVCINSCPVTLLVRNASVYGPNDVTHLGIFDIPLLSNIPNLVYLAPTNVEEYLAMLDWSIEQNQHPVAIRIPKNGVFHAKGDVDRDYSALNKYKTMQSGDRIAVIALGGFYQLGEDLVDSIRRELRITATLINPRYITGIDEDLLTQLAHKHQMVITLEDGVLEGGFGEKIASFYGKNPEIQVMNYGLKKQFVDRYNTQELLKRNRLTVGQIMEDIDQLLTKE